MTTISPVTTISAFRILELPVTATNDEINESSDTLSGRNPSRAADFRRVREELHNQRKDRLRHFLLELPGAAYGAKEWENFSSKFERNPIGLARFTQGNQIPTVSDFDWKAFLQFAIEERISATTADITPAIRQGPFQPGYGPPPINTYDVIFG